MRRIWPALLAVLVVYGCGSSDNWMARAYRNTRAHYNIYFNAEQKWLETFAAVKEGHVDDYRGFIKLYNYGTLDNLKTNQGAMEEVIKGTSTLIDKYPSSKWADDAYLLNGKAYFLKGDINAAIELFEYCIKNAKDPLVVGESKLWIFRSLVMQNKTKEAETYITAIKNENKMPEKLLPQLNKALGTIALLEGKPGIAVEYLEKSLTGIKGKAEKYRMRFALGQAYLKLGKYDKAEMHFSKVVKMNPPYDMAFNAQISQVEILSSKQHNYDKSLAILKRMLKDDKNIDKQGAVYLKMGEINLKAGRPKEAMASFRNAINFSQSDNSTKTNAYLALGDYYNSIRDFENAGLYYDSATNILDEKHPDFKSISQKSLVLSELLRHLIVIKQEDSLLRMAKDEGFRESCINKAIQKEKQNQLDAEKRGKKGGSTSTGGGSTGGGNTGGGFVSGTGKNSSFPFYNQQLRDQGRKEFEAQWGKRVNADNWRLASKKMNSNKPGAGGKTEVDTGSKSGSGTPEGIAPDKQKYYENIPFAPEEQAASQQKVEEAMFAAAGLYQTTLNEPKQAIAYYENLITRFTKTKYLPQAYYELSKLYAGLKDEANAEKYKALLKGNFPESAYTKLLDHNGGSGVVDPAKGISSEKKEIEEMYNNVYAAYKKGDCKNALKLKAEADLKYAGNKLQNKLDYIEGVCLIKSGDTAKGAGILRQIVIDYPGTAIAEQSGSTLEAFYALNAGTTAVVKKDTVSAEDLKLWKKWDGKEELVYLIVYPKGTNSNMLRATLNDFSKENFTLENLDITMPRNAGETVFIAITGFSKPEVARNFIEILNKKADLLAAKGIFEFEQAFISLTNYKTLAGNNRINSYLDFFKQK